jgi:hypothetical protein
MALGFAGANEPLRLFVEPSFMHYESAWPIVGAERTILVPGRFLNGEVTPLKRADIASMGITRKDILAQAPAAAAEVLAKLKPQYVRDENQVIQYVLLTSDSPLTATAVLAPGFDKLFTETLGPDVFIAIPNRYKIFVFPRLSSAYQAMSEIVIAEYESSSEPISRELFILRKGELSAVGLYQ